MELKQYAAEHIIENGKHYPEKWVNRYFIELADAQRALDAEREKVKRLSTCGTDHSTPWWQVKCEDLEAQLATLQAQLADRDAMILQMGEQAARLAKDGIAAKAQLRQVEGERDAWAEKAREYELELDGDPQNFHGKGRSFGLRGDLTTLRQLVEALLTELDDATYVDTDGHRYATYREDVELGNLDTVIKHARATLAAQDAPQPAPNERVEYARLELAALFSTPGTPTLEQAKLVCENKNPADAQCILNAYEALREAAQDAGKEDVSHD